MTKRFRSTFESMVFNSSGIVSSTSNTNGSVYAWMQELHPSLDMLGPYAHVHNEDHLRDAPNSAVQPPTKLIARNEPVFHKKFDMEHLFEVVVMYLFNGLNSSPNHGVYDAAIDTTALLHYLSYVIPEADKLHVVDLDAHPGYFTRMNRIRVLFDQVDYRFRVIIRNDTSGWVDHCISLRAMFNSVMKRIIPRRDCEICDCWVDLVTEFRVHLVKFIQEHSMASAEEVDTWVLRTGDICWETSTYASGGVFGRDLLRETNTDGHWKKPFIVSYWADNYLEFNGYKMARMFNGLVGYGEFLYCRDNNFCRKATNNFFVTEMGHKKMLWNDLESVPGMNNADPSSDCASVYERSGILDAVIRDGKLYLNHGFKAMVKRRQEDAMSMVEEDVFNVIGDLLFPNEIKPSDLIQNHSSRTKYHTDRANRYVLLIQHSRALLRELFDMKENNRYDNNDLNRGDGLLADDVLLQMSESFIAKCYEVAEPKNPNTDGSFSKTEIPKETRVLINRMMKTGIHIARENWLLWQHTSVLERHDFTRIQDTYKTSFWDSKAAETPSAIRPTLNTGTLNELNGIHVCNNSSLVSAYNDPAITTHALGYTRASRHNNIPCNAYALGFSTDVLQGYYDRKVHNDGVNEFIASCDITSVLRTTHTLVRGLDRFITTVSNSKSTTTGNTMVPYLQTTRTPFAANGVYYVLEGMDGVYGAVADHTAGKRSVHSDDVLTFADTLFAIVDNPGIWNLLNSGAGDAMTAAKESPSYLHKDTNRHNHVVYKTQPANVGFVNSGHVVTDGPVEDNTSWAGIAQMTYTKLRVGIMDQPNIHSSTRRYVNDVLNNTRRLSSETIQHTFRSFMYQLYGRPSFVQLFRGYSELPIKQDHVPMHIAIESDVELLVGQLYMRCKDSGLQTTDPGKANYAFPSIHEHPEIEMPQEMHRQLFYILFGETLYRIADDLTKAPVVNVNKPQELQRRSNCMVAEHFRAHIPRFLKRLTDMFFDGSLHQSLVSRLERQRHTVHPNAAITPLDMTTMDFVKVSNNLAGILCYLRNRKASGVRSSAWHHHLVSATAMRTQVVELLKPTQPNIDTQENDRKALLTFQPYVLVYNKIKQYHERCEKFKGGRTVHELGLTPERQTLFYENRMLAMRVCEEQMHFVQRHGNHGEDYNGSLAWNLLFDMFLYQRQLFAEMSI